VRAVTSFGWRPGDATLRPERRVGGERRAGTDRRAPVRPNPPPPGVCPPTARQLEALAAIASGLTIEDIARELGVSRSTVKHMTDDARDRLHAATLAQAVAECIVRGWLLPNR
jgi:DNA-binding NarL/FixJ family response regulator